MINSAPLTHLVFAYKHVFPLLYFPIFLRLFYAHFKTSLQMILYSFPLLNPKACNYFNQKTAEVMLSDFQNSTKSIQSSYLLL